MLQLIPLASILQIGISQNTKCAVKDGFHKSRYVCINNNQPATYIFYYTTSQVQQAASV